MSKAHAGSPPNKKAPTTVVRYRRNLVPGGCYFFTVALADRRASHLTTHIDALRDAVRTKRRFEIDAMVILPDHLHAMFPVPEGDADFAHRGRRIKTVFTQRLIKDGVALVTRDICERVLWPRRFWEHTIRDAADHARHVEYIHINPVKHGLVTRPTDWPHSSLHRYIRQGICPPRPGRPPPPATPLLTSV